MYLKDPELEEAFKVLSYWHPCFKLVCLWLFENPMKEWE